MIKHWTVYKKNHVTGDFDFKKRVATYNEGLIFISDDCKPTPCEIKDESSWLPDGSYEINMPWKPYKLVPTKENK